MLRNRNNQIQDLQIFSRNTTRRPRRMLNGSSEFRTVADYAPLVVWMTDQEGVCTFISRFWKKLTGRDPNRDLGFRWIQAIDPRDRERVMNDFTEAVQRQAIFENEYRICRPKRESRWVVDCGIPSFHDDGRFAGHIGTCVDVSSRRGLETRIDGLLLSMEAERCRIARELHDDLGQKLALLNVTLTELEQLDGDSLRRKLCQARGMVNQIASDAHVISHNLHPATLHHLGLAAALRRLCMDFSAQKGLSIQFKGYDLSEDPSPEVSTALYRITQECLVNILKHSGATRGKVEIRQRLDRIQLVVSDCGRGFDPAAIPANAGIGLVSIRERSRMIDAHVDIQSAPSQGTMIRISAPWKAPARELAA